MRVALRGGNGVFISAANGGGGEVVGDREAAGLDETFRMKRYDGRRVSFQTANGHYLSADRDSGRVLANGVTVGDNEAFALVDLGNGVNALETSHRTDFRHWYVRGGPTVTIRTGVLDSKDQFQLIVLSDPWMEAAYDQIKDKTLAELCLPGTHDSGTYELFNILAPDATDTVRQLWNQFGIGGATAIDQFIKGMAVTQTKTFYQQFEAGVRYIDLRVCIMDGKFFTCHSLRGHLISTLMQDVRRFLDENRMEVLVFKVGFKGIDSDEVRERAWSEMRGIVEPYFYRPGIGELLGRPFSELVDAGAPKRAIFLLDVRDIFGIYDSSITTNRGVIENLQNRTASFGGGKLLEAQCIRPINDEGFIRGYIQKHGCRLLPVLPALMVLPVVGAILAGILTPLGPLALASYLAYVRNFAPLPTDLLQNARDSRSILRDYIRWLAANPATKPQLLICDFVEDLPLVEISIRISTGQSFQDLVDDVADQPPTPPLGERLVVFDCTAQAIASAFQAAKYAVEEAGNWLIRNLGLTARPLNQVLRNAGYAGQEIVRFFNSLGREFKKFFDRLGRALNPRNWFRSFSLDPDAPRSAAHAFIDQLEEDSFRNELLPAFADVSPGDWGAVVQIGRTAGYEFTVEELVQAVPEGFFLGEGKHPELGWEHSTLPQ
jgi:hypothetical protein